MGEAVVEDCFKRGALVKVFFVKPGYKNYGFFRSAFVYFTKFGLRKTIQKSLEKIVNCFKGEKKIDVADDLFVDITQFGTEQIARMIKQHRPDVCIAASYRKIIPKAIMEIPRFFINVHPSLLPKYRGANPIYWVIKNKDSHTGVTFHFLTEGIDAGNIILQKKYKIEKYDEIHLKKQSALIAGNSIQEVFRKLEDGYSGVPQDKKLVTYAPDHK